MNNIKKENCAVLVGTGTSTVNHAQEIKKAAEAGYPIVAFSNVFSFLLEELKIEPDYWIWIDPHSAKDGVVEIARRDYKIKTTPVILHPIVDTSYEIQKQFIGTTDEPWVAAGGYDLYLNHITAIKKKLNCKIVETTTLKNIKYYPYNESNKDFIGKDLDKENWMDRFLTPDIIVLGSLLGSWREKLGSPSHAYVRDGYNYAENKLTSVALPVMQHLQFKEILLVGWDGKGNRWFDIDELRKPHPNIEPTYGRGINPNRMFTYENLVTWKQWGKEIGFKVKSLMNDDETIINEWVEHITFEDLFEKEIK